MLFRKIKTSIGGFVRLPSSVQRVEKLIRVSNTQVGDLRKNLDTIARLMSRETLQNVAAFTNDKQLSFEDTLRVLREERISFARFGDGELRMMTRFDYKLRFQRNSPAIRAALQDVLKFSKSQPDRLLIGFPQLYRDTHWINVWSELWPDVRSEFHDLGRVGNAHVSRPVLFSELGSVGVDLWRNVWRDEEIVIVTGKNSRFTLIPELFSTARNVQFEYSTATNAFEELELLLAKLAHNRTNLHLISLGPAGTVLAARLAAFGIWAIDIGHISDSYQTEFQGAAWPEAKPLAKD